MRARSRNSTPAPMRSGKPERVGDRRAHVRVAELREHRAVDVLDQRVDDALGMDDDLDRLGRDVEQPVRLDHLEALVHHRRRVDRDLASHHPVRDGRTPLGRDRVELAQRQACGTARRTPSARCAARRRRRAAARSRGAAPGRSRCARCLWAAGVAPLARTASMKTGPALTSDSLLASRMLLPARAAASVGRSPAMPDDRRHHDVGVGAARDLLERLAVRSALRTPGRSAFTRRSSSCAAPRLPASPRCAGGTRGTARAARRPGCERKARRPRTGRVARHHVERAGADAAGRAEYGDAPRAVMPSPSRQCMTEEHRRSRIAAAKALHSFCFGAAIGAAGHL